MTKPEPELEEELVNPDPPAAPEVEIPPLEDDLWNGRSSKVSLAYPILRDHVVIGPGEPCPVCLERGRRDSTHQAHFRCSKIGREWFGPEARHLQDLRELGVLRNTSQAAERARRQVEVDRTRGIEKDSVCRMCNTPIERDADGGYRSLCSNGHRNGLPELREISAKDLRKLLARDLRGGAEGVQKIEKELLREETAKLREAVEEGLATGLKPLAEALKEILKDRK